MTLRGSVRDTSPTVVDAVRAVEHVERASEASRVLQVRADAVELSFSLPVHFAKTAAVAGPIAALGLWLSHDVVAAMWLLLPVFFVVANLFEWAVHRYLMHRPMQPRLLYVRHALTHHPAFAGEEQEIRAQHELSIVLMPWHALLAFAVLNVPVGAVIGLLGGAGAAGIFAVSAVAYYCVYEVLHTLYHLPDAWLRLRWWGRLGALRWLRAHHHHHHRLDRMAHVNFSVTFPLADFALRTYEP